MEYPGVGIEPLTFCVPMPIFIRFLDARSDAEGARRLLVFAISLKNRPH